MSTHDNLMSAFAGESQANRKYLAFAKVAEKEGKKGLAKLFRVAAEAETIHALKHFENAGGPKDSIGNLKAAIEGETHEFTSMYPGFIAEADAEGNGVAKTGFTWANEVEKEHEKLFSEALAQKGEIEEREYYICPFCGHPEIGEAPDKCPVCGAPKSSFYKLD